MDEKNQPRISPNELCSFEAARKPSACTPPRINANRIFLAPSCSAPAYRLRRNRTSSGKVHELKARETSQEPLALGQMLGKNRRAGFSLRKLLFVCNRKIMKQQKNPHAGFSDSIFQERVRFLRRR